MSARLFCLDQQDGALHVRREMQLLGPDIDITGQDVVHNNIFDEGTLIVLFFVVDLGTVDGNIGHQAQAPGGFIVAGDVNGIVKIGGVSRRQRFEGFFVEGDQRFGRAADPNGKLRPFFPDDCNIGTGNHTTFGINYADLAVCRLLHLEDDILEHPIGHIVPS